MTAVLLDQPRYSRALHKGLPVYKSALRSVYREWYLTRIRSTWRRTEWAQLAEALEVAGYTDAAAKMLDPDVNGAI